MRGLIVFDHDGTLVNTDQYPYQLFLGIRELLIELKSLDFELVIWTARPHSSVVEIAKNFDILQFFSDIYGSDDGPSKPHPEGLIKLSTGFDKKNILHIGDSFSDIEGAAAFGIEVVGACWNRPNQVEKFMSKANYVASSLEECKSIIKEKFYV